ncbi:alpha/beta hydrolase [Massilia sp. R2A-15]|uniref:esterase/lipase family protein n=1 Tax=Massilia sp. R2A-15 TaxID=3064278 RepID=UPI002732CBC8|nr:alpha/beta hydrolase [Massilia sp. R2A-15]WLI90720.1 alpha/beta hydrolase [Massilia sp. R2A-15]
MTPWKGSTLSAPAKKSPEASARHIHPADLHGAGRLLLLAIEVLVDQVEVVHLKLLGKPLAPPGAGGIAGVAFRRAKLTIALTGRWIDAQLAPAPAQRGSTAQREAVLAALNGLFGDLLARAGNPLAIPMRLRTQGKALALTPEALAALPGAGPKVLILVHGLCRCDLQWRRTSHHDHGAALARDLGYTALYLHYNSGRHISRNGRELAALLDELVAAWPEDIEEIAILAHSMGGLVARSACHYAEQDGHRWRAQLRHLVFLGTPHHGAPLERHGNWLTAVLGRSTLTAPFARLGELRSAGITDLRYGNLVDEDWRGRDRFRHGGDLPQPLPLPRGVRCYTIAGTTGRRQGDLRDRLLGDGLVPLDTALGRHDDPARTLAFPTSHQWIGFGIHHLDLLSRLEVYQQLRHWLGRRPGRR